MLIRGNRLLTANIGDSRAVASIGGEALDIIEEQTPGRPDERTRIESRGGWVREEKELHMSKLHSMDLSDPEIQQRAGRVVQWVNIFRVNGELAVSRAIGDIDYKGEALSKYEYWAYPEGHDRVFHDDLVIAMPEFQVCECSCWIASEGGGGVVWCGVSWVLTAATLAGDRDHSRVRVPRPGMRRTLGHNHEQRSRAARRRAFARRIHGTGTVASACLLRGRLAHSCLGFIRG